VKNKNKEIKKLVLWMQKKMVKITSGTPEEEMQVFY